MNRRGMSLTELIVVMAIIGILVGVAALNFNTWVRKNQIEAQVKELMTELTNVRLMGIQTKQVHRVILNPMNISIRRYTSEVDLVGTQILNKPLKYPIQQFSSGALSAFNNTPIIINDRGLTSDLMTIAVAAGQADPAYNCLGVHRARVNMGKIYGNSCEYK